MYTNPRSYPAKTVVLSPGQNLDLVYQLKSGRVRMYSIAKSGQELTLHIFETGSVFPLMLVLAGTPNSYYFETIEASTICTAPTKKVLSHLKSHPDELFDLTQKLSKGLVGLTNRIETLTTQSTTSQITSLKDYLKKHPTQKFTHQDIATWLGITRETVSRNS